MIKDLRIKRLFFYGGKIRFYISSVERMIIDAANIESDVFGVQFFTTTNPTGEGQVSNQIFDLSGVFFINGIFIPKEEIQSKFPFNKELLQEIEKYNCEGAIQTRKGNLVPFKPDDIILMI